MTDSRQHTPVRVCFISPKAYPLFDSSIDSVFGGAEVDLYLLATEIAKDAAFQVSCITADYNQSPIQTIENVEVIKSLNFNQNQLTGAAKIWKALKKANAEIYLLKTASPGVPLTAAFCKLHKKIFIYRTAHQRECDGTYIKEHLLFGRAFSISLRSAKIIFTQNKVDSRNLKDTLALDSVPIPNGQRFKSLLSQQREFILWVGRSADFKKPQRFLNLAEKFPNEKFLMICQRATNDGNYDALVEKADQIKNLDFHSRIPFTQIDNFFQKAKVFVNTSDSEGFPNTFIQAAEAAAPILSLKVNPDNFLNEYKCGIDCKGSFNLMIDSLSFMLVNNNYVEIGSRGRKYAIENHDIKVIVKKYKSYFERILS